MGERVVQLCNKKLEREIGRVLCTKFDIFIFIISVGIRVQDHILGLGFCPRTLISLRRNK